jgi:hypothetical protein
MQPMVQTRLTITGLAVTCLLASRADAQRTWIVDASGGAGHHFTDLPPALAAANHGDKIIVRPGSYRGATTDRGVTVVGENARLTLTLPASPLRVSGLPRGRTFVLSGFAVDSGMLALVDNAGRVHLDRVDARGVNVARVVGAAVVVVGGAAVTATQCRFTLGPVRVTRSSITFTDCDLTGAAAQSHGSTGLRARRP